MSSAQILSMCALLFILGALLMVCAKIPHMDHLSADANIHHHHMYGSAHPQHQENEYQHSNFDDLNVTSANEPTPKPPFRQRGGVRGDGIKPFGSRSQYDENA